MKYLKYIFGVLAIFIMIPVIYNYYPEPVLPANIKIDSILVLKSQNTMYVYAGGKIAKSYKVAIGKNPIGAKEFEGDKKTPEGTYIINDKNPNSGYHKNLGISYPNQFDIERATKLGKPTGGDIKLHGLKNGAGGLGKFHRFKNWTNGCIGLTNEEIDELYAAVEIGTKIEIRK